MRVRPSRLVVSSFACPSQRIYTPRGVCLSTKSSAPLGYEVVYLISSRDVREDWEIPQKNPLSRTPQLTQSSIMGKPYGVFGFLRGSGEAWMCDSEVRAIIVESDISSSFPCCCRAMSRAAS